MKKANVRVVFKEKKVWNMYNMIFLHSVFVQVFIFVQKQASLEDQKLPELLILKSFISKSQRNKTKSVNL